MLKTVAQHTPFRPARKDLAEICFLTQWRALNEASPTLLPGILSRSRCDVRSARVAASFIVWLGSNTGAAFIEQARSSVEKFAYPEPAYLATWALINRRQTHMNANVRVIEVIMSPEDLFGSRREYAQVRAAKLNISLSDIDVVESLVVWLSTATGETFAASCEAEYGAMRALERSKNNLALA